MNSLDPEQLALLQLNLIPGLGPRMQSLLLAAFGNAQAVLAARGSDLVQVDGIGPKISSAIVLSKSLEEARQEYELCRELGVALRFRGFPDYPRLLSEIHDPSPVLYVRGELLAQDELAVAIVGSRQCTHYGRSMAQKIAGQLARAGITVISGLARGIDAAAHRGALEAGGRTVAICAPGLKQIYPPEHKQLSEEIVAQGALVTESPLDRGPQRGLFPQRNRVIAGMSLGTVIIEAGRGSGALHTARHANEQGRDVFALPGRVDSLASQGCHDLIRDGVPLIRDADDILEALGPLMGPVKRINDEVVAVPRELNLSDQERAVLNLIDFGPTAIDSLLSGLDLESSRVLSTLTVLEMRRLVRRLPGSFVERITG